MTALAQENGIIRLPISLIMGMWTQNERAQISLFICKILYNPLHVNHRYNNKGWDLDV